HIKCGNSLIGTNSELVEGEFPVDAYETSGGRDWHVGNEIRKRVRSENKDRSKGSSESSLQQWGAGKEEYVDIAERIDEIEEDDTDDIERKKQLYEELQQSEAYQQEKLAYDIWTAAFYWPMDGSTKEYPSPSTIEKVRRNPNPDDDALQDLIERATKIAEEQRFFHWDLEFPEIFGGSSSGFDCILGNPPWDKIKLEEKKWFAGKVSEIAESDSKRTRRRLINDLEEESPDLYERWKQAQKRVSQNSKFIRESGRYPLSAFGELNTYPIFTELCSRLLLTDEGRMGLVVKTGIATDKGNSDLFSYFVDNDIIISLFDFENTEGIFKDVEKNERFCLLTIAGDAVEHGPAEFSFFNKSVDMSHDEERKFHLTADQIAKINPNTKTSPTFHDSRSRDITLSIYDPYPVLINKEKETNPWGITYHRMFDMSTDSGLFEDNKLESLQERGYELGKDSIFYGDEDRYLPLWEGKLFNQLDHRFATFEEIPPEKRFNRKAATNKPTIEQKQDVDYEVVPRYWMREQEFLDKKEEIGLDSDWMFCFRDIARSHTDFRTALGTIAPAYPSGNKAPILTFDSGDASDVIVFTSIFTSFVFDYALRQSLGGATVNLYILEQLPMPTPEAIDDLQVSMQGSSQSLRKFLTQRGIRLIWTSHSLDQLGEDIGCNEGPFVWEEEERRNLRAEIDATIAKVYDLSQKEFKHILDSFDILRDQEEEEFGEYRRKQECLEMFDQIELK
ncbi:MAG: Eco57I restriction-modification methylase domain-containing protein, partial [Halobacteriaceae archaeon]